MVKGNHALSNSAQMFKLISLHKNNGDIICKRDGEDAQRLAK